MDTEFFVVDNQVIEAICVQAIPDFEETEIALINDYIEINKFVLKIRLKLIKVFGKSSYENDL